MRPHVGYVGSQQSRPPREFSCELAYGLRTRARTSGIGHQLMRRPVSAMEVIIDHRLQYAPSGSLTQSWERVRCSPPVATFSQSDIAQQ